MTFGAYLRRLREKQGISLRELAKKLAISAPYLNDIEKDKRRAPRFEDLCTIKKILNADSEKIFDLAGKSRNSIASDIEDKLLERPEIVSLLRTINFFSLSEKQILAIKDSMTSLNTSVIIIAAGLGSRLKKYTNNLPKCMLDFGGKTLLERQLIAYRSCGIDNISVIRGYKKNKINYKKLNYFYNKDYESNNILNSIFYGEKIISGNIIIAYSDILFESNVVRRLLDYYNDISVVVDIDWRGYYVNRKDHPIE